MNEFMKSRNVSDLEYIFSRIAGYFYTLYYPIFTVIIIFFILPTLISKMDNIWILIAITSLVLSHWLLINLYIPKNKSNKFGILIYTERVNNRSSSEQRTFVKKIGTLMSNDCFVFGYTKSVFNRLKSDKKIEKLLTKKKYGMMIKETSLVGKNGHGIVCEIERNDILYICPTYATDNQKSILEKEFNQSYKKLIELRSENNCKDIRVNSAIMNNSIRYLTFFIYLLFFDYDKAEQQLLNMKFSEDIEQEKETIYLSKNLGKRFFDLYFHKFYKLLNDYITNNIDCLQSMIETLKKIEHYLPNYENDRYIRYETLNFKSIVAYFENDISSAIEFNNQLNNIFPHLCVHRFSRAFLLACQKQHLDSIKIYTKLFERRDIEESMLEWCLLFIEQSYNRTKNKSLKLCSGMIYLLGLNNKEKGKEDLLEFIENTDDIIAIRYIRDKIIN